MDTLFRLGIFFLPFEGFFFAPSAGWGALSPLIFSSYLLFNTKNMWKCFAKYRMFLNIIAYGTVLFLMNILTSEAPLINLLHRYMRSLISFCLGLVNLFSFEIYFIRKKGNIEKVIHLLLVAYTTALLIGVAEYLVIKFHISSGYAFFSAICKREYISVHRVQFLFTEPSFVGVHVFGILLPFYIFSRNRKLRNLIIVFSAFTLFTMTSVRFVADTIIVIAMLVVFFIDWTKIRNILLGVIFLLIMAITSYYAYIYSGRIQAILGRGVIGDGSSASRFFRLHANFIGYREHILNALLGYGIGNSILPIVQGYEETIKSYDTSQLNSAAFGEIHGLRHADMLGLHSLSWCFYVKFISEYGMIVAFFFLLLIIKHYIQLKDASWKFLFWVIAYLYLQFEPYAFYSIWIYIVLFRMKKNEKLCCLM